MQNGLVEAGLAHVEAENSYSFDVDSPVSIDSTLVRSADYMDADQIGRPSFFYKYVKRWVDIALCCLFLPILLPLFVAITLVVRFTSSGPVFYREKRLGQFGKSFTIFKFRSMYTKEYMQDVLRYRECEKTQMMRRLDQKHTHDPRITPVGRYLRKLSLDELPQLINVLRGDMSFIGPRPVVEAELERYGNYAYFYKLMVPGITGLWQVSGRNDVSYARRVHIDAEYCIKWSLWLDMQILLRTIPVVLTAKGAY